jgi:FkbM family methyltransferase
MSNFSKSRLNLLKYLGFIPRTILDIGAYIGEWSKMAREIWPNSKIFMIEANEDLKKNLEEAFWADGFEIALLGDKKRKKVNYYASISEFNTGNSIFKEQTYFFQNCEIRKLEMITLDSLVQKKGLKDIDLIKIDTQGSELMIIEGGKETVSKTEFILLETQNLEYNSNAPDVFEVMKKMKQFGFVLFDVVEIHYLPTGEMFQIDMLFAKNSSKFVKKGRLI